MIPRLQPHLGVEELRAIAAPQGRKVEEFERMFARQFGATNGIAFGYGRSALFALLEALGLKNAEIVVPAYTCSVVGHAIVLSGNRPRFVDANLSDYNMDIDALATAINERTRMVIPTHLFGYPMNVDRVREIVAEAEKLYGHKIWIVQDCAHSFGASWGGKLVSAAPDIALFGLNISKYITSIFGGMLITNDDALANQIREWRGANSRIPPAGKAVQRRLYLLAVYGAFQPTTYRFVEWLQEDTPLLNRFTKAYHLDDKIGFPPDAGDLMLDIEAAIGVVQLEKYEEVHRRRVENALFYLDALQDIADLVDLPPIVEGATYSHFVIRYRDREKLLRATRRSGVQLGQLIEYVVPHLSGYEQFVAGQQFPVAEYCARTAVNLPVHAGVGPKERRLVADIVRTAVTNLSPHLENQVQ